LVGLKYVEIAVVEIKAQQIEEAGKAEKRHQDAIIPLVGSVADLKAGQAELLAMLRRVEAARAASPPISKPTPRTVTRPTNIPDPPAHYLRRAGITAAIHARLSTGPGVASLTAAVATAAGGYGKTVAGRLYAYEHAGDYPGGRFELAMETTDLGAQLAT